MTLDVRVFFVFLLVGGDVAMTKISKMMTMFSVVLLSSCFGDKSREADFWKDSISAFNEADINLSTYKANSLKDHNSSAAQFLLVQYATFAGMERPGSFGNGTPYAEMQDVDTGKPSSYVRPEDMTEYRGAYVVAKAFSKWRTDGREKAMALLFNECGRWKGETSETCIGRITREATAQYAATHERLDSVYLYEALQVGWLSHSIKYEDVSFGTALALTDADPSKALFIIEKMEKENTLSPDMKAFYCKFAKPMKVEKRAIDC